jgi:hypothetical protein
MLGSVEIIASDIKPLLFSLIVVSYGAAMMNIKDGEIKEEV